MRTFRVPVRNYISPSVRLETVRPRLKWYHLASGDPSAPWLAKQARFCADSGPIQEPEGQEE